ncbi:hypothetical protein [Sulfitobacter sp. R18_1]|uniref:hypothetical protein n=1 Tax=Sulfitobacter sp. R18_1 TaxID=2821104 RepID=UPI001ADCB4A2|nr:hypothetical protein [Sulfitobacter sp. R18_1]MBO9428241.1 hypothetical protein [Sulfitobacter sp. R18_1]
MQLNWQRADLLSWGEYIDTPHGKYRKTWGYFDTAQNPDGCLFKLSFNGEVLAENIDGPTIDDAEDKIDLLVAKHQKEMASRLPA